MLKTDLWAFQEQDSLCVSEKKLQNLQYWHMSFNYSIICLNMCHMSLKDKCIQRCFTLIAPITPEGLPSLSCILTACNCPNTGILVMGGYLRLPAQKACQVIIGCSINRHQRRREGETLPWLQPPLNWPQGNWIVIYIMLLAHRYRTLEFEELKPFRRNRLIV